MRISIRSRLALAIGVPLLPAYLMMLAIEYRMDKRNAIANMESHLEELVSRHAAELDGKILVAKQVAQSAGDYLSLTPELDETRIRRLFESAVDDNQSIGGISAVFEPKAFRGNASVYCPQLLRDSKGGFQFRSVIPAEIDNSLLEWYDRVKREGKPIWTEPHRTDRAGIMASTYGVPFFSNGRFRGLVAIDILSNDLLREIATLKIGGGYCFLVSDCGTFVSHPKNELVMRESIVDWAERNQLNELALAGKEMISGKSGVGRVFDDATRDPKWIVYAPVPSAGWSLAAVVPESDVMAPVYEGQTRLSGVLLLGLACMAGILFLASGHITQPIVRLTTAAQSLAEGNLETKVEGVSGNDEIAKLARTFNQMVVDLKTNVDARVREEKARVLFEGELNAAREIQTSLLPKPFPVAADSPFSLHAVNAAAKSVAGDFFDYFFIDESRLAIALADVSGKGLPAAMYMASASTKLRAFASPDKSPAEVISELNYSLAKENDRDMFVGMFFGYYDVPTGELTYVNAGQNPPYLVRRDGRLETLDPTGPLVAPFFDSVYEEERCRLEAGDTLVAFTDGVTEGHAGDYELFGERRLEDLLRNSSSMPVDALCENIVEAVKEFSRGAIKDDVTILALRQRYRMEAQSGVLG